MTTDPKQPKDEPEVITFTTAGQDNYVVPSNTKPITDPKAFDDVADIEKFYFCPICEIDTRSIDKDGNRISYPLHLTGQTGMQQNLLLSITCGLTPARDEEGKCNFCHFREGEKRYEE